MWVLSFNRSKITNTSSSTLTNLSILHCISIHQIPYTLVKREKKGLPLTPSMEAIQKPSKKGNLI